MVLQETSIVTIGNPIEVRNLPVNCFLMVGYKNGC